MKFALVSLLLVAVGAGGGGGGGHNDRDSKQNDGDRNRDGFGGCENVIALLCSQITLTTQMPNICNIGLMGRMKGGR